MGRASFGNDQIERLSVNLANLRLWDDAFALVERFYSEANFVTLLERSLNDLLEESRLPTLTRWVGLAEEKHVAAPVVDLARAELAFASGQRRKAEDLGLRAARRLDESHPLRSQAYYVAGISARMDYFSDRADSAFESALESAATPSERRDAIWGRLLVRLDVDPSNADELLEALDQLDDGNALSEVRRAIAEHVVAIRRGDSLYAVEEHYESVENCLEHVTDPRVVSSFLTSRAILLATLGRYEEAQTSACGLERYAKDARLPFVVPYARRIRAMGELGLRHFSRCHRTVEWLDRQRARLDDIFLDLETRMLRCRLLMSQGLADRGIEVLREPPDRFPFEGERGEYLATLALAHACSGEEEEALVLTSEAEAISETIEVKTLVPLTRAVLSLSNRGGGSECSGGDDPCDRAWERRWPSTGLSRMSSAPRHAFDRLRLSRSPWQRSCSTRETTLSRRSTASSQPARPAPTSVLPLVRARSWLSSPKVSRTKRSHAFSSLARRP